jgi:hypothetical protein
VTYFSSPAVKLKQLSLSPINFFSPHKNIIHSIQNSKCIVKDRATNFPLWLIDPEFLHYSSPCSPLSLLSTSLEGSSSLHSKSNPLLLLFYSMLLISIFVFRLWQDAENRVYLIKELDRITGQVSF